ncbi:MAG: efflux RND transporter permease subunit [Bdellovibrionota bacterium]
MKALIQYFSQRHLITNVVFFAILGLAVVTWTKIGKEEYPDFALDTIRFTLVYPGATAEDVELFVIKPIEERLKELTGLYQVSATAASRVATFHVTLESKASNPDEIIQEIKNAVDRARLPSEVEDPVYRRFSSAEKAIIDIGFFYTGERLLDENTREQLQKYALAFENRLLTLPEVSGLEKRGSLKPELQIFVDPDRLLSFDISMSEVANQIRNQHIRIPAGNMEDPLESQISFLSELDSVESLENTIIRGGYEGQRIRLKQLGHVQKGFHRQNSVLKIQGHEGILYNVRKSASSDILTAQQAIKTFVDEFRHTYQDSPIDVVLIDDESADIRNRISIISYNGLGGFVLILIILFIFLDFSSGIWVASGLPFSLAFTLICTMLIGYSVNNMTLAGVIIVLGIVVDDAIIIAENVSRLRRNGMPLSEAVVVGTRSVLMPVIASVLTTCAAFIPLYSFSGHFGLFIKYIPAIVFLMLGASLLESTFILPGHLYQTGSRNKNVKEGHWFYRYEKYYAKILNRALRFRWVVMIFFGLMLGGAWMVFDQEMKFVMFPREESQEVTLQVSAVEDLTRYEMAKLIEPLEDMFLSEKDVVMTIVSSVGSNRRGVEVKENQANMRIEIVRASEREESLSEMLERWEKKTSSMTQFEEIRFLKSRWGADSGSPIEFEIQENDDISRKQAANFVKAEMEKLPYIKNVEIERPVTKNEYILRLKRDDVFLLGINPKEVASSLRAYVEGEILYVLNNGEQEVDVRLSSERDHKKTIDQILSMRSSNSNSYLVPYRSIATMEKVKAPASISRVNYKRTTKIFADLHEDSDTTPLEVADELEENIFPRVEKENPYTRFRFRGEVEDSRESQSDFYFAIFLSVIIIYLLLVFLYDSLSIPLLIASIIPFGAVGVVFAFFSHGMSHYGFFAVIGTLGMIGVVVNDSIVMISKLEEEEIYSLQGMQMNEKISHICSTRLRAIVVTTLTTVAGLLPTAYGWAGYDSMLAEMMLAMAWGLIFSTLITLFFVPSLYSYYSSVGRWWRNRS